MNFTDAVSLLNSARSRDKGKPLCNNTRLFESSDYLGCIAVRLHATDVITFFPNGDIILNSGGWRTVTTKDRMNSYCPEHIGRIGSDGDGGWEIMSQPDMSDLPEPVRPERHGVDEAPDDAAWEAYYAASNAYWKERRARCKSHALPFFDGIRFDKDGNCLNGPTPEEAAKVKAERKKIRKDIKNYIAGFVRQMEKPEGIPVPSNGDCWYCLMFNRVDTRPVQREGFTLSTPSNDIGKDHDHLMQHIEDRYYVPSLLVNAFRAKGYRTDQIGYQVDMIQDGEGNVVGFGCHGKWARPTEIRRVLRDYMNKRLLISAENIIEHATH